MLDTQQRRRIAIVGGHMFPQQQQQQQNQNEQDPDEQQQGQVVLRRSDVAADQQQQKNITVIDNRSGKRIDVPITHDSIPATAFQQLNLFCFDPGYMNTAVCRSQICFIDGDNGILRYRGFNIEDLAQKSNYMEVSFLLINGELPSAKQLTTWTDRIIRHTYLHDNLMQLMKSFRYDAHPMGMVISTMAALSTFYPDANPALRGDDLYKNEFTRNKQIYRILGKVITIAACAYRHRQGRPYNYPVNTLGYTENFLSMLDRLNEPEYKPHPVLAHALDVLFILHADHELNNSTATMRHVSSTRVDPYTAIAASAGALYGPLHGGACEAVLDMLEHIGSKENISRFIDDVKNKKAKLMGFGHRIYKSYDPRAKIIKRIAEDVFSVLGKDPLIELATELERHALQDEYFRSRKLYPNVDFYTGIIYKAMGFPTDMFPVLFMIPRTSGWLAHWIESLDDSDTRIYRPRQLYLGHGQRPFVPVDAREEPSVRSLKSFVSAMSRRRDAGSFP